MTIKYFILFLGKMISFAGSAGIFPPLLAQTPHSPKQITIQSLHLHLPLISLYSTTLKYSIRNECTQKI